MKPRALVAWSTGKDSAFALHVARERGEVEIVGLLTTLTSGYGRVSMHGVREDVLDAQATALQLPCRKVWIPPACVNADYERAMGEAMASARAEGVTRIVFGDLFLEDVRAYRERQLSGTGILPDFPLWGSDTAALAGRMVAGGLEATVVCVDPRRLPESFAGRRFDAAFLADLPAGVDPCGENGEFHTCVTGGPMFRDFVGVVPGEVVRRDGFVFADVIAARERHVARAEKAEGRAPKRRVSPRVVSLLPAATEIVAALGFADALVGRSHECDFPEDVEALPVCTEAKLDPSRPSEEIHRSVGGLLAEALSVYRVDAERLRALSPTHVVTQVQCEVCAVSLADVVAALAGWAGERPVLIPLNPGSLTDVFADIERVAAALEAPERGRRLVANLRARMDAIAARADARPTRPRVVTLEWLSPLMTAGNWMPELVRMAGGDDVLGKPGRHSEWLDWNAVRLADPDVLIAFPCGFPLARVEREAALLPSLPGWAELRAVRTNRVYLAEANQYFNRPGPRLAETLEIVAEILHPDAFDFGHGGVAWRPLSTAAALRAP